MYSGDRPDLRLGAYLVGLITRPQDWIARRVETVTFEGESQVRRRVSVDVDVRFAVDRLPANARKQRVVPLPLGQLAKRPLALLDMRDASGSALPILGRQENGYLAWSSLVAHAAIVLGVSTAGKLPRDLVGLLESVARDPLQDAERSAQRLRDSSDPKTQELLKDIAFSKHLTDLARNFLLVTTLDSDVAFRQVLKFSFAFQPDDQPARIVGWASLLLGRDSFQLSTPALSEAASYHLQLVAPPGLEIVSSRLHVKEPYAVATQEVAGSHAGPQGHVQLSRATAGTAGDAEFVLRAPPGGLLGALTGAATIAVLLLALATVYPQRLAALTGNSDAAAALLLAVPGVVSTYLTLPGEVSLVSRVLRRPRVAVLGTALSLYALAIGIVVDLGCTALRNLSLVGLTVSGVATAFLLAAVALGGVAPSGRRTGRHSG